jgi:exosortase F-associated protein
MFQNLLKHKLQIFYFLLAVCAFALIRNYESVLFYDPFLAFFKGQYSSSPIPALEEWKLYLSLFFRYFLNTALSVFIIFILFQNKEHVRLSFFLYLLFFIILLLLFIVVLHFFSERVMALFYIRRFLIQPLFLLLFIPGFYFQQQNLTKQKT